VTDIQRRKFILSPRRPWIY